MQVPYDWPEYVREFLDFVSCRCTYVRFMVCKDVFPKYTQVGEQTKAYDNAVQVLIEAVQQRKGWQVFDATAFIERANFMPDGVHVHPDSVHLVTDALKECLNHDIDSDTGSVDTSNLMPGKLLRQRFWQSPLSTGQYRYSNSSPKVAVNMKDLPWGVREHDIFCCMCGKTDVAGHRGEQHERNIRLWCAFGKGRELEGPPIATPCSTSQLDDIGEGLHSRVLAVCARPRRKKSLTPPVLHRIIRLLDNLPDPSAIAQETYAVSEKMVGTSIQEINPNTHQVMDRMALVCLGCTPSQTWQYPGIAAVLDKRASPDPPEGPALAKRVPRGSVAQETFITSKALRGESKESNRMRMPMGFNEHIAATDTTMTIIWSMPTAKRAPMLNATAEHLKTKGFQHVFCCANPPGPSLGCPPNMYSTRAIVVMLSVLFDTVFGGQLPEKWEFVFTAMDTVRLGPHENFSTCIRWLNHEGMHVMGFGDWVYSEASWWGGTFIGWTRKAFLAMIHRLQSEMVEKHMDIWWKLLGKSWNRNSNSNRDKEGLKQYLHPERAGPHPRTSTTLVLKDEESATPKQAVTSKNFGGCLCPDGRDFGNGSEVIKQTGPPGCVKWFDKHGGKIDREIFRNIFLKPELRPEEEEEEEAGPPEPGLWKWSPTASRHDKKWVTAPWQLASPWLEEHNSLSQRIKDRVESLISSTPAKSKESALPKCKGDTPLFKAMLEAVVSVHGGTPVLDRNPKPPPEDDTRRNLFHKRLEDIRLQLEQPDHSTQLKKIKDKRRRVHDSSMPEELTGVCLDFVFFMFSF